MSPSTDVEGRRHAAAVLKTKCGCVDCLALASAITESGDEANLYRRAVRVLLHRLREVDPYIHLYVGRARGGADYEQLAKAAALAERRT